MKYQLRLFIGLVTALLLSSCGAIPTLPPLDSTITVKTPQVTVVLRQVTATSQMATEIVPAQPSKTLRPLHTATWTALPSLPTATPSATIKPKTSTPRPSSTATFTPTYTFTPTATFTATAVPYQLQGPNPYYLANFTHPAAGCSWLGVAGQVFSKDGQVQKEIVIKAGGTIKGKAVIETMTMPLAEPAVDLAYGPGGFELTLSDGVASTNKEAWIQLYNLKGNPLSEKIYLVTYADCQKNLILMNFSQK